MIPKIIHYCWLSDNPVPDNLQIYMDSWHKHMPGYEYVKWDFSRFDINSSIWVKEAFENKKYAFAADYIRIYALYTMGGIYLDMDVEVLKSFDNLLNRKEILCYESGTGKPEVAAFGAEKGCQWLKPCLDYYQNRHFVKDDGSLDTRPLPHIVYDIVIEKGFNFCLCESLDIFEQHKNSILIFPCDYFSPKSYHTGIIKKTNNTYSIHHFTGSWIPIEQKIEGKIWKMMGLKPHRLMWHVDKWLSRFFHIYR